MVTLHQATQGKLALPMQFSLVRNESVTLKSRKKFIVIFALCDS